VQVHKTEEVENENLGELANAGEIGVNWKTIA
jgi:hypothetical protein